MRVGVSAHCVSGCDTCVGFVRERFTLDQRAAFRPSREAGAQRVSGREAGSKLLDSLGFICKVSVNVGWCCLCLESWN